VSDITATVVSQPISATVSGEGISATVGSSTITASAGGGIGPAGAAAGRLSDLQDVDLSGLSQGDVLRYDADNKWHNKNEINLTDGGNF
jgi:hypothetical protein